MLSNRIFEEDPFFASHREHMRQMNQMFTNPFGFGAGGMLGLTQGPPQQQHRGPPNQVAQPDLFGGFGAFGGMFQNMRRMMDDMNSTFATAGQNPSGQVFSQSSFMSYSNMGGAGGAPKVYQATSSTTRGPGGVKETRQTVRDSESGVEKVAVGHHINERGHVVQRQRNRQTGAQEENREFINLDEEEAGEFDREWMEQSRQMYGHDYHHHPSRLQQQRRHHDRSTRRALMDPSHRPAHTRNPHYRDRD